MHGTVVAIWLRTPGVALHEFAVKSERRQLIGTIKTEDLNSGVKQT